MTECFLFFIKSTNIVLTLYKFCSIINNERTGERMNVYINCKNFESDFASKEFSKLFNKDLVSVDELVDKILELTDELEETQDNLKELQEEFDLLERENASMRCGCTPYDDDYMRGD